VYSLLLFGTFILDRTMTSPPRISSRQRGGTSTTTTSSSSSSSRGGRNNNTHDHSTIDTRRLWDFLSPLVSLVGLYVFLTSFFLAKRSLPHVSTCDQAATLLQDVFNLTDVDLQHLNQLQLATTSTSTSTSTSTTSNTSSSTSTTTTIQQGCWMDRKVDSMVMIVIDALRFDFALHHLPKSVGARLQQIERAKAQAQETNSGTLNQTQQQQQSQSRLFQFVADPPTVTMQRLKALTTGGLPTFADISGNMGGATVEEDTWIQQLKSVPYRHRGLSAPSKVAFVGDDTWLDLFPHQLDEAYPYPSFNTRDLNTVDDGCLHHIPSMLDQLRTTNDNDNNNNNNNKTEEVMIVHFLGVDHVGHTYGPHNQHMDSKLNQMDDALCKILDFLDQQESSCSVAFIFGDHGMTEDGNHGGGSDEEINAALFAHFSPACGISSKFMSSASMDDLEVHSAQHTSDLAQTVFTSIHQIDLVPTLSLLLGLPIPYANLGSFVPALGLMQTPAETATALALNAAQVWRYFVMYSTTANQLPGLDELEERLQAAVAIWKETLSLPEGAEDSTVALKACSLFKIFLAEALQLGQQVWTRFDTNGMTLGGVILGLGIVLWSLPFFSFDHSSYYGLKDAVQVFPPPAKVWEYALTLLFVVFACGVLSFGNSYILEEEHIYMYMIGVLSSILTIRLASVPSQQSSFFRRYAPLMIPVASRIGELFVTGHGQDPSVRAHSAHHAAIFLSGLLALCFGRYYMFHSGTTPAMLHMAVDCIALACLAQSWWEKRHPDPDRHGFLAARCSIALVVLSLPLAIYEATRATQRSANQPTAKPASQRTRGDSICIIIKILILITIVTGPSAATSVLLFSIQAASISIISGIAGPSEVPSAVVAALWRFIVRHTFFATNHGCTFSRLQLSAAFVATDTFNFVFAGASLFINTFGWEIVGLSTAWWLATSNVQVNQNRSSLWRWYCLYQLIETLCSCISVSLLRRHLMVWDIYAPHFLFISIFTILFAAFQLLAHYCNRSSTG